MEKRSVARNIAYIETVLAVLKCVVLVFGLVFLIDQTIDVPGVSTGAIWGGLAVSFVILSIEAFAAFSLIRATSVEFDGLQRLRWIRFWRGITVFFVILQILGLAYLLYHGVRIDTVAVVLTAVLVIYRYFAIYLVQRYNNEIQVVEQRFVIK